MNQAVTQAPLAGGVPPKASQANVVPVLFLIDQLCEMGGAERVLLRMIRELPRERFAPRLATFKIDESLGFAEAVSCPLDVFPLRRTYDRNAWKVAGQLRALVRSHGIQITHTFHETSDLWGGMIARWSGCPLLISSRRDMGFLRLGKHRRAYRWFGRYFSEVQTVSDEVRKMCIEQDRLDPARVVTIHNGIDLPASAPVDRSALRARLGIGAAAHVVVAVGHIRRIKGYDVMLRAAADVCKVMPETVFLVAGDTHEPDHAADLQTLAGDLGLGSRVRFLGPVDDVRSLLRASDVYCLPSRSEGLSNALLEAMACELPCVATHVGGNPEVVVEGKTGYLVEREDATSLAAALLRVLQHLPSARHMGAEGRRIVEEQFTTRAMMKQLIDSYERLLLTRR